jgi:flavin-dependent dehydrogenase
MALGLWKQFYAAGHVAGYEQRVSWGGPSWTTSSLFACHGHLWHVNRARFDADLRNAAQQQGVPIRTYRRIQALQREDAEWCIGCDQDTELRAKYVVDATGRSRAIARRLGVRPRTDDRLIAFTAVVARNPNPEFAHAMLLESTPQGWWYAAPVPQGHVLAFFTDADLRPREFMRGMQIVAANSSFAQAATEEGWVTVGDACAAHDPLCGWGVCRAMANGILAADAIDRYVRTADASGLEKYRRHCCCQYDDYRKGLADHYAYEQRWCSFPFWVRRIAPAQAVYEQEE